MLYFLKRLKEVTATYPDRVCIVDHDGERRTSYRELCEYAGRVNRWLKQHGIGREDVVGIYYPKGMEYIATRIGVIMSGAAWVGLEDMMGQERISYVVKDCDCKVVFGMEQWYEAMAMEADHDYPKPDEHDLAFYVYTSGSTGNPKGAAEEYGVYDNIMQGTYGFLGPCILPAESPGKVRALQFCHVLPETFVGGVYITIGLVNAAGTIHVISPALTRDLASLVRYFVNYKIDTTFMTPTFLKALQGFPEIRLRGGFTGGEIVSGLYSESFAMTNVYGPSEFGFPTCLFQLDRAYENTPIGYPVCGSDIRLLDEEGRESDEGHLCIDLPYFRGYHNLPKETERAFVEIDGRRFFRSGDYARKDELGRYVILGRVDDVVNLNGNRVDPSEVEKAIRNVANVEACIVRPYEYKGIKQLCAYYTGPEELDARIVSEKLLDYLPDYMLPACYMKLPALVLNKAGKVDKRNLPLPGPEQLSQNVPHILPEDEQGRKLCTVLGQVLGLSRPMWKDEDFFRLGGDSILAMQAVYECGIEALTVSMIYEGRTAGEICRILNEAGHRKKEDATPVFVAPVNNVQRYLLDYESRNSGTTSVNLPVRIDLKQEIDLERFVSAIKEAFLAHPTFLSSIRKTEEGYEQYIIPELAGRGPDLVIETASEEEVDEIAGRFVEPFKLDGSPLMRCRIFRTKKGGRILFDVWHGICDGESLFLLFEDVGRAYYGEKLKMDYCFELLKEELEPASKRKRKRDADYFKKIYDREGWDTLPAFDINRKGDIRAEYYLSFDHTREEANALEKRYGLGKNGLYIVAAAMALAVYNGTSNVMLTWIWHGRSDIRRMRSAGVFIRDLPIAFMLNPLKKISNLFNEASVQIREGISHASSSYWMEKEYYYGKDLICLLFQGDFYEYPEDEIVESIKELPRRVTVDNALDMEILDSSEDYGVLLAYNSGLYEEASMERFAALFVDMCRKIVREDAGQMKLEELW